MLEINPKMPFSLGFLYDLRNWFPSLFEKTLLIIAYLLKAQFKLPDVILSNIDILGAKKSWGGFQICEKI